ncbi:MAG: LPS export ABC transporter periplasmic protein LptC [Firmicutes bacterium]|nr:LPS export ABC transporter periplasmic protein LptC [Bacillota bacterium]
MNPCLSKYRICCLIMAVFFFFFFVPGCGTRKGGSPQKIKTSTPSPTPSKEVSMPVFLKGTTLQSRDKGVKNWELNAKEVVYDKGRDAAEAKEIEVKFFDQKGKDALKVVAKGADLDIKTNSLKFKGEVEATSVQGEKLVVRKLRWDNKKKLLYGSGHVKITRKNSIMTSDNMEADPQLKKVIMTGNVKVIYPDEIKFLNNEH